MNQLKQKILELDLRVDKLELATNKVLTLEKITSFISNEKKYQTNFVKGIHGNSIKTGTTLLVKIRGAKVITGKISYRGILLLINQSHDNDEDNNSTTIQFKLKHRRFRLFNYNLPLGEYTLHLWFYDESSGERGLYKDVFQIIH